MEFYLMPTEGAGESVTRDGVQALFLRHNLPVLGTETEVAADGLTFWVVVLDDRGTQVQFQEREGKFTFATLENYMASDPILVDRVCGVLEGAGWEIDSENVG